MAGSVKKVENAKVAVYTSGVDISQTETKGTVLLKNANEMLNFTRGEEEQLEKVRPHVLLVFPSPPFLDSPSSSRSTFTSGSAP